MDFDQELDTLYQSRTPLAPTPSQTPSTTESKKDSEESPRSSEDSRKKSLQIKETDSSKPKTKYAPENDPRNNRTLFVGNVTIAAAKKPTLTAFKKLFTTFGEVESIRFRSIPFQEGMPGKWVKQARSYHTKRESMHAYVVMRKEEHAQQAKRELNGTVFENLHLRVDAATPTNLNAKRSIFVGGLDYHTTEEQIWNKFLTTVGEVQSVRLIREGKTGLGKGIAYVQFKEKESVKKALQLSGTTFENKIIRIQPFKKNLEVQKTSSNVQKDVLKLPRRREKTKSKDMSRTNGNEGSIKKSFNSSRQVQTKDKNKFGFPKGKVEQNHKVIAKTKERLVSRKNQ